MRGREHITSRENSKLKHVRRVRDGKESGWIFIEGVRLAEEALRSALAIRSAFVSTDALEKERIEALAGKLERRGVEVLEVAERLFPSITDTPHPQGIVLTADKPAAGREVLGAAVDARTPPLVLYLNRISDPGNLGAIARTAEAAGVSGAILSMNSAGAFSPRALRASMGSGFRLPFWEGVEPHEAFVWARGRRLKVTAAAAGGSVSYTDIDWNEPRLLVLGSEGSGLEPAVLRLCDEAIHIPMQNEVESLNVAVAAGVMLFEGSRTRK